jgi:hypothetical protein
MTADGYGRSHDTSYPPLAVHPLAKRFDSTVASVDWTCRLLPSRPARPEGAHEKLPQPAQIDAVSAMMTIDVNMRSRGLLRARHVRS